MTKWDTLMCDPLYRKILILARDMSKNIAPASVAQSVASVQAGSNGEGLRKLYHCAPSDGHQFETLS